MNVLSIVLLTQLAVAARQSPPVLGFPEAGLDDTASYGGYQTRFYRDAAGNTVQIYLDGPTGRVVHLLANADNESVGFTARDTVGRPVALLWAGDVATVAASGGVRTLEYQLAADVPLVRLGLFLLGSMRVERDFQYAGRHRGPYSAPPFTVSEMDRLLTALERLEPAERQRHLLLLGARDPLQLRARLTPTFTTRRTPTLWTARVSQPALDGRDSLAVEVRVDPSQVVAAQVGNVISMRARTGSRLVFTVRVETSADALTPLARTEIFTPEFLAFLNVAQRARVTASVAGDTAATRARWLERQVRGVELLSSREKLMAGLPNYATYFGRDMLVAALMMRPIWRPEMSELVIASVLQRLSPSGQVSHEEALGGQAVREAAAEYATLVEQASRATTGRQRSTADSLLAAARAVLGDMRRIRENYHMVDDELQLPVLTARWISDPGLTAEHKRAFLLDTVGAEPRLSRLLRELALVGRMTAAYAANPVATNLIPFPPRPDSGWSAASWRDSGVGYAGGRFAMDVNAIWAPHALESIGVILRAIGDLGLPLDSIARNNPDLDAGTPLGAFVRDSSALGRAIATWWGASEHFVVRYGPNDVAVGVAERLTAMSPEERSYWRGLMATTTPDRDSLVFLALALDASGRPIPVVNTDPATQIFLGGGETDALLRDVALFVRRYPVGLFIDRVGPVVVNDAYAAPPVWQAFERDSYHGPRVVWGREVNLFLAGVANRIAAARGTPLEPRIPQLRAAIDQVQAAADASGFQSELWSYEIRDGRLQPVRYGISSDVQLWSTTDLAVQFALARLRR